MAKEKSAQFAVKLQDDTSAPARNAADALEELRQKLDQDQRALREMQAAMRRLKGGTATNTAAFKELRDKIAAQKAALAEGQAKFVEMGGTFGDVKKKAVVAEGGLGRLGEVVDALPGPLADVIGKLGGMRAVLAGGVIAGAILAIVAAMAALVAAAAAATAALLKYGAAHADARRSELLHLQGLTTIRRWYGLAAGSAKELQSAIDRVSDSSALGRDRIAGYAEQLHRMGLRGQDLQDALEGMSIAGSVQGERWAQRFAGMAAGAVRAGQGVRRLTDDVRARLGGIAQAQALSFDRQMTRLHENIVRLTDGLNLEPLLEGLHTVTSLFSQSTATGRALKVMYEKVFQPLVDALAAAAPIAKRFFQGMVIGAQLVVIMLQRLRNWWKKTFGDSELLKGINMQKVALYAGLAVLGLMVVTVIGLTVAFGALAAVMVTLAAPFLLAAAAAAALGVAIGAVIAWATDFDWGEFGRAIVDGLIGGLRAGVARVRRAVQELGRAAQETLRSVLQIRSPSRVFAHLGMQISRGVETGVDAGAEGVDRSVGDMVDVPGGAGRGGARVAGGRRVQIQQLHIHAQTSDPQDLAQSFSDALARLLEGVAIEMGAPLGEEPST